MNRSTDRYLIWGYTDLLPEREVFLASRATKQAALRYAQNNPMATSVEDNKTNAILWLAPEMYGTAPKES